ncbi:MAG: MotA/TolQ/ExbB proton channel family protein [Sandaracinaceae bacterium]
MMRSSLPAWRLRWALFLTVVSTAVVLPFAAWAQEGGEASAAASSSSIFSYFDDGGPVMYVILALSIIGWVVFIERAFDLYILRRLAARGLIDKVVAAVEARSYRRALDLCQVRSAHPLLKVFRAGILRADRREKEIERAMEKEMLAALPALSRRLDLLALLANSATLVGLLGTIFGLIAAFNSISVASAAARQEALASGISQAMYTTAFGISVAVPLLFFHHFIARRQEAIVMEVEDGATALLVALSGETTEPEEGIGTASAGTPNFAPLPA